MTIDWSDFELVDMRVGVIVDAQAFPEARKPALKLWIDFGELGVKRSSAQITDRYTPGELVGRRVVAVVNFPPKQIGPFVSEVLVLGAYGERGEVILLRPGRAAAQRARRAGAGRASETPLRRLGLGLHRRRGPPKHHEAPRAPVR